ncbi:MAG: 50S ribosomal protein L18 [Patescibacteria group bacterium]|nr:50S ribosomal protein L18 [Patescibacteria group bacterium]
MDKNKTKTEKRLRRHHRTRAKVSGTTERPRLTVFKSNKYIYAQLIDDEKQQTIVAASSAKMGANDLVKKAKQVGNDIAELAKKKKIKEVVFDKSGYLFTGRVEALAEGSREGGLKF